MANELIKTTSEIAAALGLTEFGKRVIGPSMDEVGERLRGRVKRLFDKAEPMVVNAGIPADAVLAVRPKVLLPIIEGASVEDDETMHTMFAALLANGASPGNTAKVRPRFIAILKEMAPDEAALLWAIKKATDADNAQLPISAATKAELDRRMEAHNKKFLTLVRFEFDETVGEQTAEDTFNTSAELLRHAGLIDSVTEFTASLTPLGHLFLESVRPPKPKA